MIGADVGGGAPRRRGAVGARNGGAVPAARCPAVAGCGAGRALRLRALRQCATTSGRSPWISSQVSASSSVERWSRPRWARGGALDVEQPRLHRR